jgi:hypothetical protein
MTPELDRGKAELEAVLASRAFAKATSLQQLLRYVCARWFEGKGEDLKEYTIAADVFGRGTGFDQRNDSIVRVEAFRLRKRLKQYYDAEGSGHPVRIVLPPGRYIPEFVVVETNAGERAEASPSRAVLWAGGAVVAVLLLAATATWGWKARTGAAAAAHPAVAAAAAVEAPPAPRTALPTPAIAPLDEVHLMAGRAMERYTDCFGTVWTGDRFFTGGKTYLNQRPIAGTRDEALFQAGRRGNLRYDIPLVPREYEMRLYFADDDLSEGRAEGGGENSRLMNVHVNGKPAVNQLDVFSNAGGSGRAYVRTFRGIRPAADGWLHLGFNRAMGGPAFVNAIELIALASRRVRPIRLVARDTAFFDHDGVAWFPDTFVAGGHLVGRDNTVAGRYDAGLFRGERFGRFTYTLPLPPGRYSVALYFAETYFGPDNPCKGGIGRRVFNVFCNHEPLLRNFDVLREAGGTNRGICKRFGGLQPDVDGKLALEFVPVRNYPCLNALEVTEDGK